MSSSHLILLERLETEQREQARKHKDETMELRLLELNLSKQQKDEMFVSQSENLKLLQDEMRKKEEAYETREAELKKDMANLELTVIALTVKGEQDAKELANARTMAAKELANTRTMAAEIMEAVSTEEAKQLIAATPRSSKRKRKEPVIGFKRVGSIEEGPWSRFFNRKYPTTWQLKMKQELSTWERILRNPEFRPLKNVQIGKDQWKLEIDEQDQQLTSLRKNYGIQVYRTVTTALMELEEYNGSERYPISHAWNFDESRIATLEEVFAHLGSVTKAFLAGTETPPINPILKGVSGSKP